MECASRTSPYRVKVLADSGKAVRVQVLGMGIRPWLPRSKVKLPDKVKCGDEIELHIPQWLIKNEIGEPF